MTPRDVHLLRDPEAMRRAVALVPVFATRRARLSALALDRLWVKPGRHCHAAYRVTLDRGGDAVETLASATLLRDPSRGPALLRAARAVPAVRAPWTAGDASVLVDSPCALVQLFPWDHRLPTLARAVDPTDVGGALGIPVRTAAPVGYWPGVRCQIRYETNEGTLFGKVFPDASGEDVGRRLAGLATALEGASELVVPRVRAWIAPLELLVTTPLAGDALGECLRRGTSGEVIGRVAAALARLHATALPDVSRRFAPTDDLAIVQQWVAFAGAVFPELEADLRNALARLEQARPVRDRPPTLVHRDFYDRQVLIGGTHVGLLDLDTLCQGDPEIDVANFCAHLVLRGLQWYDEPRTFDALATGFTAAYRACRPDLEEARVAWYRASASLRLACVYGMRPWWTALVPSLIRECHRALD